MNNLQSQRETIQHAKASLDETETNLKKSMRVANAMARRIVQHKIIMYSILAVFVLLLGLIIYWKTG